MHRKLIIIAVIAVITLALAPLPMPGDTGAYNTLSRLYWCGNPQACWHEQAHAMDQRLGWVSQSDHFGQTLQIYLINQIKSNHPSKFTGVILETPGIYKSAARWPWNAKAELYADIYMRAGGDVNQIPNELQMFYERTK